MEAHQYDTALMAKRFERARNNMLSWKDYDDGSEFAVRDLVMIDQRDGSGIACIIEYTGADRPEGRVGFIAVCSKYAPMFVGTHIIVKTVPADGNWLPHHSDNESEYKRLIKSVYNSDRPDGIRCQEILAIRRQLLLYNLIFPNSVDASVTDYERLLVSESVILNNSDQNIEAMREYISRVDGGNV